MAAVDLEDVFRGEWPRILASVVRFTGSIELAEDAVQLAFERAAATPDRGLLINPAAWITTVAKRIAIDAARREIRLREKLPLIAREREEVSPTVTTDPGEDDRLGMLFLACTPALEPHSRLALALRFVGGLPTREVASVMLVGHSAMNARLTRAKHQIQAEGIRFEALDKGDYDGRLGDVQATIHAIYTVGHTTRVSDELGSRLLAATAIELARALRRAFAADDETAGLLGLLLLTQARSRGRLDDSGRVVTLEHADRRQWRGELIVEGLDLAAVALRGGGRFSLEAGISGLHCQAARWDDTDWPAICALYDRLVIQWPSPSALIARIVARSYSRVGPERALLELDALPTQSILEGQMLAARADILRRLGRNHEARAAYGLARSLETNTPVRDYFSGRIGELGE